MKIIGIDMDIIKKILLFACMILCIPFNIYTSDIYNMSLPEASYEEDIDKIYLLMMDGADINEEDEDGHTALHWACKKDFINIATILIQNGADIDQKDKCDDTALHYACIHGYTDIIKLLIDNDADINAQSRGGNTALHYACKKGFINIATILIQNGADINQKDKCDDTALHITCRCGHTPFHKTFIDGHIDVAQLLIKEGAHINAQNDNDDTALHYACEGGYIELVKILIDKGADIHIQDKDGHTALHKTCIRGHAGVAQLLIKGSAHINAQNNNDDTALHYACEGGYIELVKILIDKGADIHRKNKDGNTALCNAWVYSNITTQSIDIMRLLIIKGADIDALHINLILNHNADTYIYLVRSLIERDIHPIENLDSLLSTIQKYAENLNDQNRKEEIKKLFTYYRNLEKKSSSDMTIDNYYIDAGYLLKRSAIRKNNTLLYNYLRSYAYRRSVLPHLYKHMKMINYNTRRFSPLKYYVTDQYTYNSNMVDNNTMQENIRKLADYARTKKLNNIDTALRHAYMAENNTFSDIDIVCTHKSTK
jgi:ankyrin repeat protein